MQKFSHFIFGFVQNFGHFMFGFVQNFGRFMFGFVQKEGEDDAIILPWVHTHGYYNITPSGFGYRTLSETKS